MSPDISRLRSMSNSSSASSNSFLGSEGSTDGPELIEILYASETGNAQDAAERVGREVRRRGGRCRVESMEDFDLARLPHTPLLILLTSTHGRGQPPPAMLPLWNALLRSGLPDDILEDVSFAVYALGDSSYEKFCYAGKILARRMLGLGARLIGSSSSVSSSTSSSSPALNGPAMKNEDGLQERLTDEIDRMDRREELNNERDAKIDKRSDENEGEAGIENVGDVRNRRERKYLNGGGCLAWGDERAPDGIEETFLPWLEKTMDAMLPLLQPPPPEFEVSPWTTLTEPLYSLVPVKEEADPSVNSGLSEASEVPRQGSEKQENAIFAEGEKDTLEPGWTWANLVEKRKVTPQGWNQDVRQVELSLEDGEASAYLPGSICSLKPETSEEEIRTFLRLNVLEAEADRVVLVRSRCADQPIPRHLPQAGTRTTLRRLLQHHLDVRSSPRKSFFEWLRRFSPNETEQERLEEFVADPDEIHTYATRPRRTILETIGDFRATKIPLSHLLEALPPLRRRQFSIASNAADHPGKVQLLVALVDYKTNLQVRRRGLLSSWLRDLTLGSRIPLKLDAPTLFLPTKPGTPVILVGPGTGVAPMRAFLEQRLREGEATNTALYFGCRSKDADLYYENEWDAARSRGAVIRIACSRDQAEKHYVQDRIKEDSAQIYDWVYKRGGSVYISGSSNAMPKAVRSAIAWCLSTESQVGTLSTEEATAYVEDMFESGARGGEESW